MSTSVRWADVDAPSLVDFEQLATAAWNRLPGEFRRAAGDIVIRVEDFAADEILDSMGIEDPFDLTGLYQGVSLDRKSVSDVPQGPDLVFLYRRPLIDETGTSVSDKIGLFNGASEPVCQFGLGPTSAADCCKAPRCRSTLVRLERRSPPLNRQPLEERWNSYLIDVQAWTCTRRRSSPACRWRSQP